MRAVIGLCVCVCYVVGQDINAMKNMPKYDARYDYLDVDAILDSKRLVKNYVECLINSQRCTPEGKALKRLLPEALRTKCVRCSERQKRTAVKVIKRLKYEFPEEWAKLSSRWDPTGDFTRYFEETLDKEHFNTIYGNEVSSRPPPPPVPVYTAPPVPMAPSLTPLSPAPAPSQPAFDPSVSTEPKPVILNRFGDDGELMNVSPSSNTGPMSPIGPMGPMSPIGPMSPMGPKDPMPPMPAMTIRPTTVRYVTSRPTAPTPISWSAAASDSLPTRFPARPYPPSMPPALTTAYTIIDQISFKIMRTTELVSDILRNTVRAVVG